LIRTFPGDYQSVAFADNESVLLGPTTKNPVKKIIQSRITDGVELATLDYRIGVVQAIAPLPNGRLLFARHKNLNLWSLKDRRLIRLLQPQAAGFNQVLVSDDKKTVVAPANGGLMYVWQLND